MSNRNSEHQRAAEAFPKRRAEFEAANEASPYKNLIKECSKGGLWGYFVQKPKFRVDLWGKSHLTGKFKTFDECETVREKRKDKFWTEVCEPIKIPPPQAFKVVEASYDDFSGNNHRIYFSTVETCQQALREGLYYYNPEGPLVRVERNGYGFGGFNDTCEEITLDACDPSTAKVQLQR